jgi:glycosyltransferase involved in cell wall biosynthesis|tara:strand:+ start:17358 stop:18662 length:1305 start_codon:yes stop_codon:yes gene_type:complete
VPQDSRQPGTLRILISTDAFPPVCGGSGWSTYELVKTLRANGHRVVLSRPVFGPRSRGTSTVYDGFQVREYRGWAPPVPFVRNYFKNERFYGPYARVLADIVGAERIDVIHAQHSLSSPAAVIAGRLRRRPVVCTIRDYWPLCYWTDLIHDPRSVDLCPACSSSMMTQCVRPHAGWGWPFALPAIPYMRANLRHKRRTIGGADALIAVSSAIASDLRSRTSDFSETRIEVIPNPVDVAGIRSQAHDGSPPSPEHYLLYVGKLAPNKGVSKLIPAVERSGLEWPLIVIGDGPERATMTASAARSRLNVRLLGWLSRKETLRWLCRASLLVFPSHGPESLSRVLLEAAALGVPTAAMVTGGTRDIVSSGETGLLSTSPEELGDDVRRLGVNTELRRRLGQAARRRVEERFAAPVVVRRIEALYEELLARVEAGAAR